MDASKTKNAPYVSASSELLQVIMPSSQAQAQKWTRMPVRMRPHRNPLAENDDKHYSTPSDFEAELPTMYPRYCSGSDCTKNVEFLDVGCAFGGMLFDLCAMFPDTLMLGLEIRGKVVDYAKEKVAGLRALAASPPPPSIDTKDVQGGTTAAQPPVALHHYQNVWFDQLNVMRYGSNLFHKGGLSKIFFCYPDPHWKRSKIRRRIISPGLVQEYAYWLREGGEIYTVSDVEGLEEWMVKCLDESRLFRRLRDEEVDEKIIKIVTSSSEDAIRTERKGLKKNWAVHVRIKGPEFN